MVKDISKAKVQVGKGKDYFYDFKVRQIALGLCFGPHHHHHGKRDWIFLKLCNKLRLLDVLLLSALFFILKTFSGGKYHSLLSAVISRLGILLLRLLLWMLLCDPFLLGLN